MRFRYPPSRAALHFHAGIFNAPHSRPLTVAGPRAIHSTRILCDDIDNKNYYETLNVQRNASAAEIKKSFYTLSKTYHPDHNQDDPLASKRFMRISEAYSTLSHIDKRAKYDRDVLRVQDHRAQDSPRGSYSSTGPAGGRPASGLSRRRGTFQGPPPSFYRSGGWGAHGSKRQAAHDESTGGGGGGSTSARSEKKGATDGSYSWAQGGMGPDHDSYRSQGEVPHFDRAAHTRTQERMRARRVVRGRDSPGAPDFSHVASFVLIMSCLGAAVILPYLALRAWTEQGVNERKASRKTT